MSRLLSTSLRIQYATQTVCVYFKSTRIYPNGFRHCAARKRRRYQSTQPKGMLQGYPSRYFVTKEKGGEATLNRPPRGTFAAKDSSGALWKFRVPAPEALMLSAPVSVVWEWPLRRNSPSLGREKVEWLFSNRNPSRFCVVMRQCRYTDLKSIIFVNY